MKTFSVLCSPFSVLRRYWRSSRWHRIKIIVVAVVLFLVLVIYGTGFWYAASERSRPLEEGVSFIPDYAASLGVDPQQTMDALLHIGVRHFRLVSYWSDLEPAPGHYDFSQLDWQFKKAEAAHAQIILTVGLRQPRWPECHQPSWVDLSKPTEQWYPALSSFMAQTINRYKHSPALQAYQVENEYFLAGFGACPQDIAQRYRLVDEYNLVKRLDPQHPAIVTRSNNALGFPVGQPQPDEFSISIYRRVWDGAVTHRYLEYPFPAQFYGFLAGVQKIFNHRDMIIGELQAEPWPPHGQTIPHISLSEQNKSFNAQRFSDRISFAKDTGMRGIYYWGAEYWYYRAQVLHDPSVWNVAKQEFQSQEN